jgi:hypothetical protein
MRSAVAQLSPIQHLSLAAPSHCLPLQLAQVLHSKVGLLRQMAEANMAQLQHHQMVT